MADATSFLTIMGALSASVQTFVEHVIKTRSALNTPITNDPKMEARRVSKVHALTFAIGGALTASMNLPLLSYLGVTPTGSIAERIINALAAGLMVSYGSSFFDETLGAVREFKKAQEAVRSAASSSNPTAGSTH